MKKQILFAVVLFASHAIVFFGGTVLGKESTTNGFLAATRLADAEVILGHYSTYRDISVEIGSGEYRRAKCNADLGASAMFDGLRDCLLDTRCATRLQQIALSVAPEILGDGPMPFDYASTKNGRKDCVQPETKEGGQTKEAKEGG